MMMNRINQAKANWPNQSTVVSLSRRQRSALEKTYPGFEGKVLVFDETVSLASAELVQITDINRDRQWE